MPDNYKKIFNTSLFSKLCREFVSGVRLLTIIPAGRTNAVPVCLTGTTWSYPVIGAIIGLIGGMVFAISVVTGLPTFLAAVISLVSTIFLTGALHEDGLADTADSIGSGLTHSARLKIMHDSRTGAYGALALIISLSLRAGALAALTDSWLVSMALISAGGLSRGILPLVMSRVPLASNTGMAAVVGTPSISMAITAFITSCVLTTICLGISTGLLVTALSLLVAWVSSYLARRYWGGYNGDLLGAAQQTTEITVLLGAVVMI